MIVSPDDPLALADERVASPARLAAAHRSGLLNSPPEESFDALTRLATSLIGAPVSFLSISGADRDVYKSQFGFPEPLASGRQMTGRTFCHYALTSDAPLVIEDTHADALWRAVPTVDSMGIRAYLGVPLIVDGEAIGSLCVVDSVPRAWTPLQIDTLSQLAESAGREVQLRNALKDSRAETLRANDLARTKEELIAVVVHDLRSPMQVIGACSTLMRREPNPAIQDHTVRIDGALASMKSLVDDLLSSPVEGDTPHRHAAATGPARARRPRPRRR